VACRFERSARFLADVEEFGAYCQDYSADQADRLDHAIRLLIGEGPLRWSPFVHTGRPYHAYLFRVGERTQFWSVYAFDEASNVIRLLRLWYASRNEASFSE
jgi:hypothetical protein